MINPQKVLGVKSRIGRRLMLYILLFSSVITFMGTGLQLYLDYDHDVKMIHTSFEQVKSSYLDSITNSLWVTDGELLRIQLEGILRLPDMQLIEVRKGPEVVQVVGTPQSDSIIEQTIPLVYVYNGRDVHLGELHVVASLKGIYSRLLDRVLLILGVQTIKTFMVSLFIFVIFYQLVGKYIIYMASFVESINFESLKNMLYLDRKPLAKEPDELDSLVNAFNRMRENLSQDIIMREAAEKELRESEDKFRSISDRSLVGIYLIQDNIFQYVNPKFCEIFGYTVEECLDNMPFIDLVHPDEIEYVREQVRKRLDGEAEFLQYETRCMKKNGKIIDIVVLGATTTYKGSPAAIGTVLDITERKQTEEKLLSQQYLLQNAQEIGKIGTWELDIPKNSLVWTDETYKIFGISFGTKLNYEIFMKCIHPDDRSYVDNEWKNSLEGNKYDIEHRILVDGKIKWIREKARFEFNESGDCIRAIGFAQDISDKKEMEARLQQAQKMESIGTLAGGIAHDFNNILFPIVGMSELLLEDLPENSIEFENAKEIFTAGKRGSDLVKQILAFSRQTEHKMVPVKTQKIIEEVVKLSRATIPSNIKIDQQIQSDCGTIIADQTQLHQIAMNLVTNAYHAVEKTNGKISVVLKETEISIGDLPDSTLQPGQYVVLTISDTGDGMNHNMIEKIFEPYFTTKEQGKGTGLGLAVVYGIVKEHGGHITVYSEIGIGTTFNVYLPVMKADTEYTREKTGPQIQTGNESILLVDDEVSVVKLEKAILERLGYEVTAFSSSPEALETFRANPAAFDLIISDMTMPDITGDKLAEELLSIRPDIPILICTGFSERINKAQAEEIGVKGFLMKPIIKSEMAKEVRNVLDDTKNS